MDILYRQILKNPGVCIDTRHIKKDDIFFCFKGEHLDANDFVVEALEKGASIVVTNNKQFENHEKVYFTKDTLSCLQSLAIYYRSRFNIPIIAITGTNGKTTTKELCAAALNEIYKTHYTLGNYNNHIGVPLTILSMPIDTEIALIEMGANKMGDIAELCKIASPNFGIITNIGQAHLEGFFDLDTICKTKGELYQFLEQNQGKILINEDEPSLQFFIKQNYSNALLYGIKYLENKGLHISIINNHELALSIQVNETELKTHFVGNYNFQNIISMFFIGNYFEVSNHKVINALSTYIPQNNRSQLGKFQTSHVIYDYYNSNPSSLNIAIENLVNISATHKALILGDMKELGEKSIDLHHEVLLKLENLAFEQVFFVGSIFYTFKEEFPHFKFFYTVDKLREELDWKKLENHVVLVKGSRGIKLEKLF